MSNSLDRDLTAAWPAGLDEHALLDRVAGRAGQLRRHRRARSMAALAVLPLLASLPFVLASTSDEQGLRVATEGRDRASTVDGHELDGSLARKATEPDASIDAPESTDALGARAGAHQDDELREQLGIDLDPTSGPPPPSGTPLFVRDNPMSETDPEGWGPYDPPWPQIDYQWVRLEATTESILITLNVRDSDFLPNDDRPGTPRSTFIVSLDLPGRRVAVRGWHEPNGRQGFTLDATEDQPIDGRIDHDTNTITIEASFTSLSQAFDRPIGPGTEFREIYFRSLYQRRQVVPEGNAIDDQHQDALPHERDYVSEQHGHTFVWTI